MTLAGMDTWPWAERPAGGGLVLALAAAALLHLTLLAAIFWQPADSGAQAPGQGGLTVSLGPAGAAPGAVATLPAEPVETEAEPSRAPSVPAAPAQTRETRPEAARMQAVLPLATGPAPEIAQPVAPPSADDPQTATPADPAARPAPAPLWQVDPVAAPEAGPEAALPVPPAEPVATGEIPAAAPETSTAPRARPALQPAPQPPADPPPRTANGRPVAPVPAGAGGRGGEGGARSVGSGDASSGGGDPGARADFAAQIAARLARHKAYPRAAQLRRIEGTGVLWFRIDAAGRVTAHRITRSAGHPMLDAAIEETLRRAQPLPPIPSGTGAVTLEFAVPMRFSLR